MMRARNIKPGFFVNEFLVVQPPLYRLLFAGLWCMADRRGLVEDRPAKIKLALFPADDIDVAAGLAALAASGELLTRYVDGRGVQVIAITNFKRHQNPHHREPENPNLLAPGELPPAADQAQGRPGADPGPAPEIPGPAGLNPESGILNPESGILNPGGGLARGRPEAGPGPARPASMRQRNFAGRLLDAHGLTVERWLADRCRPVLLDSDIDSIKAEYGNPPAPRHAWEAQAPPEPDLSPGERAAGLAALAALRAAGGLPGARPAARVAAP